MTRPRNAAILEDNGSKFKQPVTSAYHRVSPPPHPGQLSPLLPIFPLFEAEVEVDNSCAAVYYRHEETSPVLVARTVLTKGVQTHLTNPK